MAERQEIATTNKVSGKPHLDIRLLLMTRILTIRYYAHSELVHFSAGMNTGVEGGSIQLASPIENGDVC